MKNSKNIIIILLIAAVIGIGILAYHESNKGPLEKTAEKIDQSIEDAGDKIESTTDDLTN